MQENVNAINVRDYAIQSFGSDNVSTMPDGVIKAYIKAMGNGAILTVSNMLQWADVHIKRSGKGLVVLFNPRGGNNEIGLSDYDEKNCKPQD